MATTSPSATAAVPVTSAAAPASAPVPAPSTTPPPAIVKVSAPSGVLQAPDLPSASGPGEIVAVQLQNNSDGAQGPGEVAFGHVFRQGDLGAGEHLTAVIGGREVPVQMDVKATHPDGSVRHAILTIDQPGLAAGESATAMLKTTSGGPGGATIRPADIVARGYDVDVNVDLKNSDGSVTRFKVDAGAELAKAAADGTLKTWMSGPLASEYRVVTALNDHLDVTLDIRAFKDGSVRTDVVMGVESSYQGGLKDFYNYDIEILDHGKTAYAKDGIAHYRNSRWHEEVWSKDQPNVHVAQDVDYMKSTGAVVDIDSSMGVAPGSVALPSSANTEPMGNAMISKDMSQVGGRGDLGIMPIWNARYLASQNEQAQKTMLANADAAGSIPWHYRDEATGEYLRIDDHPNLWMDGRTNWPQFGDDGLTNGFPDGKAAGWAFDTAHQPALSYLPYLVTGSQYYLDELMAQTTYSIASFAPHYRGQEQGFIDFDQVRSRAWTWRDMSDAAYITPDDHAMKGYFDKLLDNNLDALVKRYIIDGQSDKYGDFEGFLRHNTWADGDTLVWQSDFVALALGTMAQRGYAQAEKMVDWMDNFTSGRFIHGDDGFDPRFGSAYLFKVHANGFGPAYDTWAELFKASFGTNPGNPPERIEGWPSSPFAYAANARATVAQIFTVTHSPDAMEAFGYLSNAMVKAQGAQGFYSDPTWNISPRLADGDTLDLAQVRITHGADDQYLSGTNGNELLHGAGGDDQISGANGIDILFGDTGDDTLIGGAGNDFIYGGAGNDVLNGGAGDDYLKGNGGDDRFVFGDDAGGRDTISEFRKHGADTIEIDAGLGGSIAQIIGSAGTDESGDAVLHIGSGLTVTLLGVGTGELKTDMFHIG